MKPARLAVIDVADLPDYPIPRDMRLDGHHFTRWNHNRWLNSRMYLMASLAVKGAARDLFDHAQNGSPIGTLPSADDELAALMRVPVQHWRALCDEPIGPLHNWQRCRCGDEVRLMHPVVLEVLQDTIRKVEERDLSKEERAISARRDRLVKALLELGCLKAVIDDHILIGRIDLWLLETWKGNRTRIAYLRALDHAQRSGWLGIERKLL